MRVLEIKEPLRLSPLPTDNDQITGSVTPPDMPVVGELLPGHRPGTIWSCPVKRLKEYKSLEGLHTLWQKLNDSQG